MGSYVRISALLWADILVAYALFVMQDYLTDVWEISFTHAAGILNIWGGVCMVLPLFFLFLVDSFLGNFVMLVISSIAYTVGIGCVAMSTPTVFPGPKRTCKQYKKECIGHTQHVLFYTGMALIAVGVAGHLVSVKPFHDEQNDKPDGEQEQNDKPDGDHRKAVMQLFGFTLVAIIPIVLAFALANIKPWSIRFGLPAICTLVATLLFFSGWCYYNKAKPRGSPLTNVCRVFVAFAFKIREKRPLYSSQLNRGKDELLAPSRALRCLEKAAILPGKDPENSRWRLCTVAEVEEAKIAVRMVPMWMTFIVVGIVSSIGNTYFIEQAKNMDRNLGKWRVPLPVLKVFLDLVKKSFFARIAESCSTRSKKYGPPIGIAIAMIFAILCCMTAALVEKRRVNVIISHGLLNKPDEDVPMSMYWLLFQFFLLGGVDAFFEKSTEAFYAFQAPETMKSYLVHFTKGVSGLGFTFSVISVYVVGKVSEKGGRRNWFQYTLNRSRLDRYYWVLAALSAVNLLIFVVVALIYRYKDPSAATSDTGKAGLPLENYEAGNDGGENDERSCCC